jgi:hypothetical protein
MSESIAKRINGANLGTMTDGDLRKLFAVIQTDLVTLATHVNNMGSALNNIKTNCSNATVNVNIGSLTGANLNTQQ